MDDLIGLMTSECVVTPDEPEDESQDVKPLSPFDILNDISYEKTRSITPDNANEYNPFFVNRGLSQHMDTILLANEMNKRHTMDPYGQYLFLELAVGAKKRYGKWSKGVETMDQDAIELVSSFYETSKEKAMEYIAIGGDELIERVREQLYQGGL